MYTKESKLKVVVHLQPSDQSSFFLYFQAYNWKKLQLNFRPSQTLDLTDVDETCYEGKCHSTPGNVSLTLPDKQLYTMYNHGLVHEFKVTTFYDFVLVIGIERKEGGTVTVFDGPNSNVPHANAHSEKWITTAFCAFIRVLISAETDIVDINFESVSHANSHLINRANLMCRMSPFKVQDDLTRIRIVSHQFSPIPQLCILKLMPQKSERSYVTIEASELFIKTDPWCSTAGIVFIDKNNKYPYYSRPVCSSRFPVKFTSQGSTAHLVLYSFWPQDFHAIIHVRKTDCVGINAECLQLRHYYDFQKDKQGITNIQLKDCAHVFILPNAPATSQCNAAILSGTGKSLDLTIETYFQMSNNQSDVLSLDLARPSLTTWYLKLPENRSHLSGVSQLVSTVYDFHFSLTTLSDYTAGGYFIDIEMKECLEIELINKKPPTLIPLFSDNCGSISVPFPTWQEEFFIKYTENHYFELSIELSDPQCSNSIQINITDYDALYRPLYIWDHLVPRMRWRTSGTLIKASMKQLDSAQSCVLNFTFTDHSAQRVQEQHDRYGDECVLKSPIPLVGKDQSISYILRGTAPVTWEEAEEDCSKQDAILFSPYNAQHMNQLLKLVDHKFDPKDKGSTPCQRLAQKLWKAPATFIGLSHKKVLHHNQKHS